MLDPKYTENSPLFSRVALALGLLIAGSFGIGATYLIRYQPPSQRVAQRPAMVAKAEQVAPQKVRSASDPLVQFCSDHVTPERSFVIFRYGTCVVVDEPTIDPVADARARLEACNDPEARFVPELTREGELLVSFEEPVFHSFTEAQRAAMESELDHLTPVLLTPKERALAGDNWVPPTHARFGLLARRRMLEDAAHPTPTRIIRSRGRLSASTR